MIEKNFNILNSRNLFDKIKGNRHIVINHKPIIEAIDELAQFKMFESDINIIKSISSFYNKTSKELSLVSEDMNYVKNSLSKIKTKCNLIISLLNDFVVEDNPEIITVKFPEITNLGELKKNIDRIEKTFNQLIINEQVNGELSLNKISEGSVVFEFFLGSTMAVITR